MKMLSEPRRRSDKEVQDDPATYFTTGRIRPELLRFATIHWFQYARELLIRAKMPKTKHVKAVKSFLSSPRVVDWIYALCQMDVLQIARHAFTEISRHAPIFGEDVAAASRKLNKILNAFSGIIVKVPAEVYGMMTAISKTAPSLRNRFTSTECKIEVPFGADHVWTGPDCLVEIGDCDKCKLFSSILAPDTLIVATTSTLKDRALVIGIVDFGYNQLRKQLTLDQFPLRYREVKNLKMIDICLVELQNEPNGSDDKNILLVVAIFNAANEAVVFDTFTGDFTLTALGDEKIHPTALCPLGMDKVLIGFSDGSFSVLPLYEVFLDLSSKTNNSKRDLSNIPPLESLDSPLPFPSTSEKIASQSAIMVLESMNTTDDSTSLSLEPSESSAVWSIHLLSEPQVNIEGSLSHAQVALHSKERELLLLMDVELAPKRTWKEFKRFEGATSYWVMQSRQLALVCLRSDSLIFQYGKEAEVNLEQSRNGKSIVGAWLCESSQSDDFHLFVAFNDGSETSVIRWTRSGAESLAPQSSKIVSENGNWEVHFPSHLGDKLETAYAILSKNDMNEIDCNSIIVAGLLTNMRRIINFSVRAVLLASGRFYGVTQDSAFVWNMDEYLLAGQTRPAENPRSILSVKKFFATRWIGGGSLWIQAGRRVSCWCTKSTRGMHFSVQR
ncbi:hypothetical protein DFJ73DRAFT_513601 [Zopfochytrium polystomum]|nr:hypothetical protein DFJ73DRAFT_513601 [Zopfochytrium polystomum]